MKRIVSVVVTAILAGSLAFYGGVRYSQSSAVALGQTPASGFPGSGNASGTAGFRGGAGVGGEVLSADGSSITVKTADGSTRTVYLASTTRVTASSEATLTDLAEGITVVVAGGSGDTSGTLTARSIQIVPAGSSLASAGVGGMGAPQGSPQQ